MARPEHALVEPQVAHRGHLFRVYAIVGQPDQNVHLTRRVFDGHLARASEHFVRYFKIRFTHFLDTTCDLLHGVHLDVVGEALLVHQGKHVLLGVEAGGVAAGHRENHLFGLTS